MSIPIGARVRTARLAADFTIAELAAKSGVSARSIGDIERGATLSPQRATLDALSLALPMQEEDGRDLLDAAEPRRRPVAKDIVASSHPGSSIPQRFIGRESELARLRSVLDGAGTAESVIIFGSAGVGKSSLVASAISEQGRSHAVFVEAAHAGTTIATPLLTIRSVLAAAAVDQWQELTTFEGAVRAWHSYAAKFPPILVLDGIQDEAPVRLLLSIGGYSALLVTSRLPLAGISGIGRLHVAPFSAEESVRLLRERSPSLLRQEFAEVAELCDFLPLALDLISSRLESSSRDTTRRVLRGLRAKERRLDILRFDGRSVKGALQPSYDALDSEAAGLFRTLSSKAESTFVSSDVAALAGLEPATLEDSLEALADWGLLEALPAGIYRIPELVRLFGMTRIAADSGVEPRRFSG